MKKFLVIAVTFIGFSFSANAQFNWGVKAGLNISSFSGFEKVQMNDYGYSYKLEQSSKAGFHVGINVQYMFTPQIGIESGFFLSTLGAKLKYVSEVSNIYYDYTNAGTGGIGDIVADGGWREEGKITVNPVYLQLPISFLYKFNLGKNLYLYPSAGFYLGYGIDGKIKTKYTLRDYWSIYNETVKFDVFGIHYVEDVGAVEIANRFDMGLIGGLTLQYSKFTFGVAYQQGLTIFSEGSNDAVGITSDDLKNRNFKISVGYFF